MENTVSIDEINSLVRKSFGIFYKGNYHICSGFDGSLSDYDMFSGRENTLEFIAKPTLLEPQTGCGVAGLLGKGGYHNSDGSVIVVRKDKQKYISGAKRYAQLYKEKFNRDVKIIYVDDFADLIGNRFEFK